MASSLWYDGAQADGRQATTPDESRPAGSGWLDDHTFLWVSPPSTTPSHEPGQALIKHLRRGIQLHLFVREAPANAPGPDLYTYHGPARYLRHTGDGPVSVVLDLRPQEGVEE